MECYIQQDIYNIIIFIMVLRNQLWNEIIKRIVRIYFILLLWYGSACTKSEIKSVFYNTICYIGTDREC